MFKNIKRYFTRRKDTSLKEVKELPAKGKRKLTKKERKKIASKINKVPMEIVNRISEQETVVLEKTKAKKITFFPKLATVLGSGLILFGCCTHSSTTIISSVTDSKLSDDITEKQLDKNNTAVTDQKEEKARIQPIALGDSAVLNETSRYYVDSPKTGPGYIANNEYVNSEDYNIISAIAIVDENKNVRYTNYNDGFEIYNIIKRAEELGITNYEIMLHMGPLTDEQLASCASYEVNNTRLGWVSIDGMNKVKQKSRK